MRSAVLATIGVALAGCASLADRYERGNAALSTPHGLAYLVLMSPMLHRALDECLPPGTRAPTPVAVLVADVTAKGTASAVRFEPGSEGTNCVERRLAAARWPPPPLRPGEPTFPVGLRVDLERAPPADRRP